MSQSVVKNAEIKLTIESLAYGGMGVARHENFVIFVKNALPEQEVLAFIYKIRRGYAEARVVQTLLESPYYVKPNCAHFTVCGGCSTQNLNYDEQVKQKVKQVEDIYVRQAGIDNFVLDNVVQADNQYNYRNKMEFSFSNRPWYLDRDEKNNSKFALGLHVPKRYDKIVDIEECHIQDKDFNKIIDLVRTEAIKNEIKPYDNKTNNGYLRHLMLRKGFYTKELMVNIVTSYEDPSKLNPIKNKILKEFPNIQSIVNNINTRKADVAYGEKEINLHGESFIHEKLADVIYEISANSFFQTNSQQAVKLFETVKYYLDLKGDEIVFDLFCGTGSISLFLAKLTKEVYGFDVIKTAIEDATRNSVINGIGNAKFFKVNLDTYFKKGKNIEEYPNADALIVDPPRSGLHKNMLKSLPKFKANKIIYVSCNPTTQARDIVQLIHWGWKLESMTLIDMFPHTPHIETVALLKKN